MSGLAVAFEKSNNSPQVVAELAAREPFAFKQVFQTKGANGERKELVFAMEVKNSAEANMAVQARKNFLENLTAQNKIISYFDIRTMTMTYSDGRTEAIPEDDKHIKILRDVYGRVARAREQIVSWPSFPAGGRGDSNGPESLKLPSVRIGTMNGWSKEKVIEKLGISNEDKKKRAMAIAILHEEMMKEPGALGQAFTGCSLLALIAHAAGVSKDQLKNVVEAEEGELEKGFIRGDILHFREKSLTADEEAYLDDIELLAETDRAKFIQASHKLKRPVTQDSLDHALLAAFDAALKGGEIGKVVDDFCKHPLIAAISLKDGEIVEFKARLQTKLQEAVRAVGLLPSGAHAPQAQDLDLLDPDPASDPPLSNID